MRQLPIICWTLALAPLVVVGAMWGRSYFVCDTLTLVERGRVITSAPGGGSPAENERWIGSSDGQVCAAARRLGRGAPPPPPPFPRYSPDGTPWDGEWSPLPLHPTSFAFIRTALPGGKLPSIEDDPYEPAAIRVSLRAEDYHTSGVLIPYWQLAAIAALPAVALLGIKAFANRKSVRRAARAVRSMRLQPRRQPGKMPRMWN